MLLCSKAHPATITHEFKDSDVYRPCPADSVYYAIALVSSLTVKMPFSCPITLKPRKVNYLWQIKRFYIAEDSSTNFSNFVRMIR